MCVQIVRNKDDDYVVGKTVSLVPVTKINSYVYASFNSFILIGIFIQGSNKSTINYKLYMYT